MNLCVYLRPCGEVGKNCVECSWKHWEEFEDRNNSLLFCLPVLCTGVHMCVHMRTWSQWLMMGVFLYFLTALFWRQGLTESGAYQFIRSS